MPPRRAIPDLLDLSLAQLRPLIALEALRVAKVAVTRFVYDEIEAGYDGSRDDCLRESKPLDVDENTSSALTRTKKPLAEEASFSHGEDPSATSTGASWEREVYISDQVQLFKDHVVSHITPNLTERALTHILLGVEDAVVSKKQSWTPCTNMTRFTREMYAIIKFSNLLVLVQRRSLNLETLPKMIRSKMYNCLGAFKNLHTLILGSGSGGWVTEAYADKFLLGVPHMPRLAHFSLKYDCTGNLLQVLSETCPDTLRVLDIERSKQVRDDALPYLLRLHRLADINIFQTDLTTQGQADVLIGLKELTHLRRGDFLCDAVELFNSKDMSIRLKIEEFWASEEYYFHSEDQMELTAQFCPDIRKMLFMFQNTSCRLQCLTAFERLEDLDLWGGSFYADGVLELLESVGPRLKRLSLVHVDELDERAIALITVCCTNVEKLGLHNCEFVDLRPIQGGNAEDGFQQRDRFLNLEAEREVQSLLQPLHHVHTLKIVSACPPSYLRLILGQCQNVREVFMGMTTGLSDACISDVLLNRAGLQELEVLTVQRCKGVTMEGVKMLLEHCTKLRTFKDLTYFDQIHEWQVKELRWRMRSQNFMLDTGEAEEKAKEFTEASFMRQALRHQFPATLDNSVDWAAGWQSREEDENN